MSKNKYLPTYARRNVVHSNHGFMTSMRLLSKLTYFAIKNCLVLCVLQLQIHVIAYVTTGVVDPHVSHKCDYNVWL
jgi:hypothetical protein